MIEEFIKKIEEKSDLTANEMEKVFDLIMTGKVETNELADFLDSLEKKGETVDEIIGAVKSMKKVVSKVETNETDIIDIVGTGGDKKSSINVSTACSIVLAASGAKVAKHGNRSVSSKSGSADVLEELGVNINLDNKQSSELLEKISIAFIFARTHHPAMKYAAEARQKLGKKTIFNLVGPLTNPAGANRILLGTYNKELASKFASVLKNMNIKKALVVNGNDGFDEVSICDKTIVFEVENDIIKEYEINPIEYGFSFSKEEDLLVNDAKESKEKLLRVLNGEDGPCFDIIVLNSAVALYTYGTVNSINEGVILAKKIIKEKKALNKLNELIKESNKF